MDIKKLSCIGWEFLQVWVDDHSRVAYTELLPDKEATTCSGFLLRAEAWLKGHGVKLNQVMTGNGSAYRSHLLNTACRALGAKPIKTRLPYTLRTNCKAECFIQTSLKEWAYAQAYEQAYETSAQREALPQPWLALTGLLQHAAHIPP